MWKAEEVRMAEAKGKRRKGGKEKKRPRKERMIKVKRMAKEWEIWDKEKETAKSEAEARKLVLECYHKWIQVF